MVFNKPPGRLEGYVGIRSDETITRAEAAHLLAVHRPGAGEAVASQGYSGI